MHSQEALYQTDLYPQPSDSSLKSKIRKSKAPFTFSTFSVKKKKKGLDPKIPVEFIFKTEDQ